MGTHAAGHPLASPYPVRLQVATSLDHRDKLTVGFRLILAIPHLILVGAPLALAATWSRTPADDSAIQSGGGGGLLGAVAAAVAIIAWFAILFTGRYPDGLWRLATFYLRWRVRASAYVALLRDEYPPFGDGLYPVEIDLPQPVGERDKLSVAFRIILALPQILAVWAVGVAWGITTIIAWFAILFTGSYPESLYHFGVGALRWTARVEAYLLLVRDEYPPFSLEE